MKNAITKKYLTILENAKKKKKSFIFRLNAQLKAFLALPINKLKDNLIIAQMWFIHELFSYIWHPNWL